MLDECPGVGRRRPQVHNNRDLWPVCGQVMLVIGGCSVSRAAGRSIQGGGLDGSSTLVPD
jgi:hypothetical protein